MKKIILLFLVLICVMITGCADKGALEEAGERSDEVIDNIKDGENPLKRKGTMEELGESLDEAVDGK